LPGHKQFCELVHNFSSSIVIYYRHIVSAEKVIEGASDQGLRILAGLRLHKPQAALETRREVRADMSLPFPAWRLRARSGG
jgi:hypothetical protein